MRQSSANYNENSCVPAREATAIPKRRRQHLANACPPEREATAFRTAVIPAPTHVIPAKAGIYRAQVAAEWTYRLELPSPSCHANRSNGTSESTRIRHHRDSRPKLYKHSTLNRSVPQETISNSRSAKFDRMRQSSANYNENSCPPAREAVAFRTTVIPAPTHVIPAKGDL